jgi:hypothetical protein
MSSDPNPMKGINKYGFTLTDEEIAAGVHRGKVGRAWEHTGRLQQDPRFVPCGGWALAIRGWELIRGARCSVGRVLVLSRSDRAARPFRRLAALPPIVQG